VDVLDSRLLGHNLLRELGIEFVLGHFDGESRHERIAPHELVHLVSVRAVLALYPTLDHHAREQATALCRRGDVIGEELDRDIFSGDILGS
jgi:hypothetical protein